MTVEIEYRTPRTLGAASDWQVQMAEQIQTNHNFPIEEIQRVVSGTTVIARVETDLPSQAVEKMLSDIEDHIPAGSEHVETREI